MSFIPINPPLYEDELLYSWIHRMISRNGLAHNIFSDAYTGLHKNVINKPDIRLTYVKIAEHLYKKNDLLDIYMRASTYGFESLFMSPEHQTQYINLVARERDALNYQTPCLFDTIKICPTCKKEDIIKYGEPYLHRSHHYNGICTCHKHGDILLAFHGKIGCECDYNDSEYEKIELRASKSSLDAYTYYVQSIATSGVSGNILDIRKIIHDRLMEMRGNYRNTYRKPFIDSYSKWEYRDLFNGDILRFLKTTLHCHTHMFTIRIIPVLMFLFPQPSQLINFLKDKRPNLLQYQCDKCGKIYIATPQSITEGWGCPSCDKKIPVQERFENIVLNLSHGEYILKSQFISLDKEVVFLHKKCGEIVKIQPREFIFYRSRCLCEKVITKAHAEEAVMKHRGFKLLKFTSANKPITILHEDCGKTFTCQYRSFIQIPICRICKPPHNYTEIYAKRYAECVEQYTCGEFSVVGEYQGMKGKILIRHNVCGQEMSYTASSVFSNIKCSKTIKCKYCDRDKKMRKWEHGYNILCLYMQETQSTVVPMKLEYNGFRLGSWCQKQKGLKRAGRLSSKQIEMLDSIGFEWNTDDATKKRRSERKQQIRNVKCVLEQEGTRYLKTIECKYCDHDKKMCKWEHGYNILCLYMQETQSTVVPMKLEYNGFRLGSWCQKQKGLKRVGRLSSKQIEMLDSIGFEWNTDDAAWERHYENYKNYIDETGTTEISSKVYYHGERLGRWVQKQRLRNAKSILKKERQEKLALINEEFLYSKEIRDKYCYDKNMAKRMHEWEDKYNILRLYMQETQSTFIPRKLEYNGFRLGSWCCTQKMLKRVGRLSSKKIEMLDSIGFEWNTDDATWERHYENYKNYIDETGTTEISSKAYYHGERLGFWVYKQRVRNAKGILKKERQEKLALINEEFLD